MQNEITSIKICGLTTVENALAVAGLGVDAIGLVFYAESPRCVTNKVAQEIVNELPPFVSKVGLFVNPSREDVLETLELVDLNLLQFHGDEDENYCRQFDVPYIRALRHRSTQETLKAAAQFSSASAILLDSYEPGRFGGTGQAFDWSEIPELTQPMVLAGGLTPLNVGLAVGQVAPYAVDVSGGVEDLPGIKCPQRIRQFVRAVAAADDLN